MFPEIFKIAWIVSLMESHFGKVTGNVYPVYSFVENAVTCMYFPKVALIETVRNSLSPSLSGLQPTGCNATKSELITRFHKDVYDNKMKIPENFQEEFCDAAFFQQHRKSQPSPSHDFRNLGNS